MVVARTGGDEAAEGAHSPADLWRASGPRPRPLALSTLTAYEQDSRLRIVPHWGAECDVMTITSRRRVAVRQGPLGAERSVTVDPSDSPSAATGSDSAATEAKGR